MTADDAHHEPRAGAGVAEVERPAGRRERAKAWAPNPPAARREPLDRGAESPAGLACPQNVDALEQAFDPRLAARQEAENEGAMGDRLVARRPEAPLEGLSPNRAQGA